MNQTGVGIKQAAAEADGQYQNSTPHKRQLQKQNTLYLSTSNVFHLQT
jgi:hypothetical protein